MNKWYVLWFLLFLAFGAQANEKPRNLNEAVNQAKAQGQVLSAKTVNGRFEIKVLTPSGSVKTIHKRPAKSQQPDLNDRRPSQRQTLMPNQYAPKRSTAPLRTQQNRNRSSHRSTQQKRRVQPHNSNQDKDK